MNTDHGFIVRIGLGDAVEALSDGFTQKWAAGTTTVLTEARHCCHSQIIGCWLLVAVGGELRAAAKRFPRYTALVWTVSVARLNSLIANSRILNFCVLPVIVMGKSLTTIQ